MRILVIEDDPRTADFIAKGLSQQGNQVEIAYDGLSGKAKLETSEYDLVILDVILPLMNGLELCRHIRMRLIELPVLMISGLGGPQDTVMGLEAGADDYLVKPFVFEELLARVYALCRRGLHAARVFVHKVADLEVDVFRRSVKRGDRVIILSATEFSLLELLISNRGKVLSRAFISESVWGFSFNRGTNLVAVYINYLRSKIDKGFATPLIHTIVNKGYVLKEP